MGYIEGKMLEDILAAQGAIMVELQEIKDKLGIKRKEGDEVGRVTEI